MNANPVFSSEQREPDFVMIIWMLNVLDELLKSVVVGRKVSNFGNANLLPSALRFANSNFWSDLQIS
jgi:hypothetical protein